MAGLSSPQASRLTPDFSSFSGLKFTSTRSVAELPLLRLRAVLDPVALLVEVEDFEGVADFDGVEDFAEDDEFAELTVDI